MQSRNSQPIETLRISDREKAKLLWAIEEASKRDVPTNVRKLRVPCVRNEAVLTILGEGGEATKLAALARNISRWGISLIHGRYVYPGRRCQVQFQSINETWHLRDGEICHVSHLQGLVHELGVRFDEPVDLSDFAILSPAEETQHLREMTDDMPADTQDLVTAVASRVLIVDDFASDRKLFSHWLSQAGMTVSTVADIKTARERIEETQFDLVIVDYRLGEESGTDLIRMIRNAQFVAPVIAVSADDDGKAESDALAAGANAFLNKPFTSEQVVDAARKLMGFNENNDTTPVFSSLNDDPEMRPLLAEFTRKLGAYIDRLREANATQDFETMDKIARTLKGAGNGYGFEGITEYAREVIHALNEDVADLEKIKQSTSELVSLLNRVKLR